MIYFITLKIYLQYESKFTIFDLFMVQMSII